MDIKASELVVPEMESPEEPKQPPVRRGRIPGTKLKYTKDSVKKLEKLGFDPIELLVENHKKLTVEIQRQERLQALADSGQVMVNGQKTKYSAMTHATLLAAEQKLLNDLVPYRYAKVPVDVNVNDTSLPPIMISLTKQGEVYEIDPSENVDINTDERLAYKGDEE